LFVASNSSIQRVRVSVSSSTSPYQNEINQKSDSESQNYSSMIENFVEENIKKKDEDIQKFDRRPLLDLINGLNQTEDIDRNKKDISLSSSKILPPKQISPFKPIILHKKYQVCFIHIIFISIYFLKGTNWSF